MYMPLYYNIINRFQDQELLCCNSINAKQTYLIHVNTVAIIELAYRMGRHICNSYTMAARDLPEIYTQSPRAEGVYFRQIPSSHGITDIFHLGDSTPSEKLLPSFGSLFILDFENFDCGTLKGISYSDIFDD